MKRIDVEYGGEHYSIGDRDIDDVKREIAEAVATGSVQWLDVNSGEGLPRPASLAIHAGVTIALVSVDDGD